MRAGIRGKLVSLLVAVALVPLVATLIIVTIGGRRAQRESIGQGIQSATASQALAMGSVLTGDVEKVQLLLEGNSEVTSLLLARGRRLPEEHLKSLDERWPDLDPTEEPLAGILSNPTSQRLRAFMKNDPLVAEILLTDRFGQLVAATQRTTDFYQGDEAWWRRAYADGRGRIHVPPLDYDRSSAVWSIDLCVAIRHGRRVVGVAKVVLDIGRWLRAPRPLRHQVASALIVGRDGCIVYGYEDGCRVPIGQRWAGPVARLGRAGWRVTGQGDIQAFAPIPLAARIGGQEARMPAWSLVCTVPKGVALGAVHRLTLVVLAIGLALIGVIFLTGLILVERSVIRRIRRLARATRTVAEGDLTHRIEPQWGGRRLLGRDEIDNLARGFNRMVERMEQSYGQLEAANELKTQFIRVAGHELRTPVSYILAMEKLLKASDDPAKLRAALRAMAGKARRLSEIIQDMFKLMPGQPAAQELPYGRVDLKELMEEVRGDCGPFIAERNQQLIVEGAEKAPTIQADRDKLRDIVENLVMNGIKFSPDGGIIKVRVGMELGRRVSIAVQDQGPGIPEDELPHIFQPFFSGGDVMQHSSGQAGYGKRGMGLGLTIVRQFVELHGGTVNVSSGPTGATFTVSVPIEPPPAQRTEG